jgi:YegS/Rv2252/BmrU family lipid kinase
MAEAREVLVCINRSSGTASRDDDVRASILAAFEGTGLAPQVELLLGSGIAEQVEQAVADGAKLVIVGGGDGSISAAAGVLAGTDTALGILPLGTLNHFARDLGIPFDLGEAARIIAAGQRQKVDLAEVNGRIFINNSAIGLYPLMVIDRETQQKRLGRSKRLAMLVASARTLARFNHQRLTLAVEGKKAQLDTPLLFVGNNDYQVALPAAGRRETLQDGKLSVLVMRSKSRLGFIRAAMRALIGRGRSDELVHLPPVEQLKVDSRRHALPLSLDGEAVVLQPPLTYRIRKKALTVIAP